MKTNRVSNKLHDILYQLRARVLPSVAAGIVISVVIITSMALTGNITVGDENQDVIAEIQSNTQNEQVLADRQSLNTAMEIQNALRNIGMSTMNSVVSIRSDLETQSGNVYQYYYSQEPAQMFGSGFVISSEGHILTNYHVINNAELIYVMFLDTFEEVPANLIGIDDKTDLALIKIDVDFELDPIPLGDSDEVMIGDFAIAIGNPYNLSGSMTFGIISAINREELDTYGAFKSYIQTDAPINMGNSGGPLLNIAGQVIGINTMIYSETGGSVGIGFAVPINVAKYVVEQLITHGGIVQRGFLGISIRDVDTSLQEHLNLADDSGVFVEEVIRGTAAEQYGIRQGDVIISVDGEPVENTRELQREVGSNAPGEEIIIGIIRNNREMEVNLILGELPVSDEVRRQLESQDGGQDRYLGMSLTDMDRGTARSLGLGNRQGVIITDIDTRSAAYESGLRENDVILSINSVQITSVEAMEEFLNQYPDEVSYLVFLNRNGQNYSTIIQNR